MHYGGKYNLNAFVMKSHQLSSVCEECELMAVPPSVPESNGVSDFWTKRVNDKGEESEAHK